MVSEEKIPDQEEVWNRIAKKWDLFRNKPLDCVKDFLKGKEGKILDLGCGSGRNFIKSDKLEFYGVDFSKEMVNLARDYSREEGINATVKQARAWDLPFEDDFFDNILYIATLHCIKTEEKRKKSLKEIKRVLKPGGRALVTVWDRDIEKFKRKEEDTLISWKIKNSKGEKGEKVWRYYKLYDRDEIKNLLSKYFKIVDTNFDDNSSRFNRRNLILEVENIK